MTNYIVFWIFTTIACLCQPLEAAKGKTKQAQVQIITEVTILSRLRLKRVHLRLWVKCGVRSVRSYQRVKCGVKVRSYSAFYPFAYETDWAADFYQFLINGWSDFDAVFDVL